jgi:hypothetical protein
MEAMNSFFDVSEIPITSDSLILVFFFLKKPELVVL